ncbi:MAG: 30S ribosomal protein S5 [Phycisphaerales bacterium]|nr:30S ribosomal protein S5 [Phycisphaerales bacterium]
MIDESSESQGFESNTVGVFRTAATVKGGRRFSFGALVVVGDRRGRVGYGYAKGKEVPPAIEKAEKDARRSLTKVELIKGTIPHTVLGRYGASEVRMLPASPGTGVVAGGTVRAVLELAGVRDCLTKCYGSTNKKNLVKATMEGLKQLRSKKKIEELRGVSIETTHVEEFTANAPEVEYVRKEPKQTEQQGGGRGGRRGGGDGGGRGRPRRGRSSGTGSTDGGGQTEQPAG